MKWVIDRSVCRTREKADALAEALGSGASAVEYADVASGRVAGDVLMNSTSIGMHPREEESPVSAEALSGYGVVFDAVYTPLETQLLRVRLNHPGKYIPHEVCSFFFQCSPWNSMDLERGKPRHRERPSTQSRKKGCV